MKLMSEFLTSQGIRRFKAPKGLQYLITGIYLAVFEATTGNAYVLDYLVEDEITVVLVITEQNVLSMISTNVIDNSFIDNLNHKTKYLTLGTVGNANCLFVVFGELIHLSKTEAIIEWFRKGR